MRRDTSFSEKKLTTEEFSKKYWMDGQFPYQYHTGSIEDGRDEREQFIFNNIRALYELRKYDLIRAECGFGKKTEKIMLTMWIVQISCITLQFLLLISKMRRSY